MISQLSYFIKLLTLPYIFMYFIGGASANCKRFEVSGQPYHKSEKIQQVSNFVECKPEDEPHKPRNCRVYFDSHGPNGCLVKAQGKITAQGYTNLTLPLSDVQFLFKLASKATEQYFPLPRFLYPSLAGCIDDLPKDNDGALPTCIAPSSAGYIGFVPKVLCLNGTVKECDQSSKVNSGTAVQICGAMSIDAHQFGPNLIPNGFFLPVTYDSRNETNFVKNLNPALKNAGSVCHTRIGPKGPKHNLGAALPSKYISWIGLFSAGLVSFVLL